MYEYVYAYTYAMFTQTYACNARGAKKRPALFRYSDEFLRLLLWVKCGTCICPARFPQARTSQSCPPPSKHTYTHAYIFRSYSLRRRTCLGVNVHMCHKNHTHRHHVEPHSHFHPYLHPHPNSNPNHSRPTHTPPAIQTMRVRKMVLVRNFNCQPNRR